MADFKLVIGPTEKWEGGFQNMPSDPGNYCDGQLIGTMRGIAASTFKNYRRIKTGVDRCPTKMEMLAITKEVAMDIFYTLFWKALINGDKIKDNHIAWICYQAVIGAVVNLSVIRRSINKVAKKHNKQLIVESPVAFNDYTIGIINSLPTAELFNQLYDDYLVHLRYVDRVVYNNKMVGWYPRMQQIKDSATAAYKWMKENPGKTIGAGLGFFSSLDMLDTNYTVAIEEAMNHPNNVA